MFLKPANYVTENGIKKYSKMSPEKNHLQRVEYRYEWVREGVEYEFMNELGKVWNMNSWMS